MGNDAARQPKGESRPGPKEPATGHETVSPGRVDYRCADLRGCDMGGISLEHADFRAADLQGVNFSGCNLRYADFRGANVQGASFQNASLYGAKMQGAEAFQADFRNSDLRQANFGGAYLDKAMMPPLERRPSPGEIAEMRDAASEAKGYTRDTMKEIGAERSSQLSPSHTPGRRR